MDAKPFVVERTYEAPADKVWQAITNKEQMKEWYFKLDAFKPEVGFEFQFRGEGHEGEKYLHLCRITEVIPGKKLSYTWKYEGHPGESLLTFELFAEGNKTRLVLTHAGLETFPVSRDFAKESFAAGWTELIGTNLKNYVEKP